MAFFPRRRAQVNAKTGGNRGARGRRRRSGRSKICCGGAAPVRGELPGRLKDGAMMLGGGLFVAGEAA